MKKLTAMLTLFIACSSFLFAQQNHQSLLSIHEDQVMLSEEDRYWEAGENLVKLLDDNNVEGSNFWAFRMEDGTYMFVSPTENYASLDNNMWEEVMEKAGADNFQKAMSGFAGTYLSHEDYMVVFHPDKSYKMDDLSENDLYREWHFQYVYEDKLEEYNKLMDEWLAAFKEVDAPIGYGVYTNGFGMPGPVTVIMIWGENQEDVIKKNKKTTELMNGKRRELWNRTKKIIHKNEVRRGWVMPDLSHMPTTE